MIKINEDLTPWLRGYMARRTMLQKKGITDVAPYGLTQSPSLRNFVDSKSTGSGRRRQPQPPRRV